MTAWAVTCGLAFALGFLLSTSPGTDLSDLYAERVRAGCIPIASNVTVGPQDEVQGVVDLAMATAAEKGYTGVHAYVEPVPEGPIAKQYPGEPYMGFLFYESCVR